MHTDLTVRSILSVSGADSVHFLQGLLTQDVSKLAEQRIQFAALLSAQGKILHDMFLVAQPDGSILLDTAAAQKETLLKRLSMYKLRAQVVLAERSDLHVDYAMSGGLPDPRHPALPHRVYAASAPANPSPDTLTLGIPELGRDFAPDEVVALDAGYDALNAVSFTKGCYVGQEITARMHYKQIARRGFYMLERNGKIERLALLKFEDALASPDAVVIDGISYRPCLPEWIAPKYTQFLANREA